MSDALTLAARIRAREVSSLEVVRDHLQRIDAVNPAINAVVRPAPDCEERARGADEALARGEAPGPLHGVPFTVKDAFDTAGLRTTRGSALFEDHVPSRDAVAVERLRGAGAIMLGKTNLPDFCLWVETDNLIFGRTSNPWNPSLTAGGSSGGEAAAIAAELSPLGVGSDLAGSVRLPAHYCGVVGLKPTHGVVPLTGHWPETLLYFMHVGFLARTVGDVAAALVATAGPDGRDAYAAPLPEETLAGADEPFTPCRVGLIAEGALGPADEEVNAGARRAASAFEELGCAVEEVTIPALAEHDWHLLTLVLFGAGGAAYLDAQIAGRHDQLHPSLQRRLARRIESLDEYLAAEAAVEALRSDLAASLSRCDVLLCPTAPITAHPHGAEEVVIGEGRFVPRAALRGTAPFDVTGSPALTIPYGLDANGLPYGVQLVGRRFEDAGVLRAGAALEQARGPFPRPALAA